MTAGTKTSQRGVLRRSLWTGGVALAATMLYPIIARVAIVLAHGNRPARMKTGRPV